MNKFEELIRLTLVHEKMTLSELAEKVGMSQPNFSKKLAKNNFNETDMRKIAKVLNKKLVLKLED